MCGFVFDDFILQSELNYCLHDEEVIVFINLYITLILLGNLFSPKIPIKHETDQDHDKTICIRKTKMKWDLK